MSVRNLTRLVLQGTAAAAIALAATIDTAGAHEPTTGASPMTPEVFDPGLAAMDGRPWYAPRPEDRPVLLDGLGRPLLPDAPMTAAARAWFDQGLALAVAFNHAEALRAFREAQRLDPACALCAWGEAYVLGPNLNAPMAEGALPLAADAARRARALADGGSTVEQALADAVAARYAIDADDGLRLDPEAYAHAMTQAAADSDEPTLAMLAADALMNLQPWDYWADGGSAAKGRTADALALLEDALDRNPSHPGLIHFYIHLVEASDRPERAEPYADRLAELMPGAGHIVHMPAHIYLRIGRYRESVATNIDAIAADEAVFAALGRRDGGIYGQGYYPHNLHFALVSAQMAGDAATTLDAAQKLAGLVSVEAAGEAAWLQPILQAPWLARARFEDPATLLARPEGPAERAYPFVAAARHYARAVAAVRGGDTATAAAEREAVAAIRTGADFSALDAGGVPAGDVLDIALAVIDGRAALAAGDAEQAVEAFRRGAALQDGLPYMEPPYWDAPVSQALGAALMRAGRPGEAMAAFQDALDRHPNSGWALWGLAEAAEAAGDRTAADDARRRFAAAWLGDGEPSLNRL